MDLIGYLHVLKRRWYLVLLPFVGALLVAYLTLPDDASTSTGPRVSEYTATATLIAAPSFSGDTDAAINMQTVALFAGLGEVPQRAAEILAYPDEPQILASTVTIAAMPDTGTLNITSTDQDPTAVAERVNAFARATKEYFKDKESLDAAGRVEQLTRRLDTTTRKLQLAQRKATADPENPVLEAKVNAYQAQYTSEFSELSRRNQNLGGEGPVSVLQQGVAIPKAAEGFVAPTSPMSRLAIAGMLGLLLGVALALVVERLDSRMRTREQAEDSYGLPVLSEIPPRPWTWRADREIHSAERPASDTAEAHRSLRSSVLLHAEGRAGGGAGRSLTLLVTSSQPSEGKTTTVANLAAVMAEAGRSVLVLSLDLRNPRIHEFFGVANDTGMAEVLRGEVTDLDDVVRDTSLRGVRIITSGQRQEHPGALLTAIGSAIAAARDLADVIIIDAPPLLTVTDAVDIGQHVDAVLLTCRLNKTTYGEASAAFRLVTRLGLPAIGLVLVGSRPSVSAEGYRSGEARAVVGRQVSTASRPEVPALVSPKPTGRSRPAGEDPPTKSARAKR